MLTVTPEATAALAALLESPELPAGAGVRFVRATDADGTAAIGLTVVTEPGEADEVVPTAGGVDVYVAPEAAETLDDQELDADVTGDGIAFSLHPQTWNGGPPSGPD